MYRISVALCLVGFLAGIINAAEKDCASEYAESLKCMLEIKDTDEAKSVLEEKMKIMKDKCAPDYPKKCIAGWEAMGECCKEMRDKKDEDPEAKELMNKTASKINECFDKYKTPLDELEPIFIPPFLMEMKEHMMMMHKGKGGKSKGKSGEKGGKSGNSSESASGESGEEDDLPPPPPPPGMGPPPFHELFPKECKPKKEQIECLSKEIKKSVTDGSLGKAFEALMKKQEECYNKVSFECELCNPKLTKCFFGAHQEIMMKMVDKLATCVKGKVGGGEGKDTKSADEKGKDEKKDEKDDKEKEGTSPKPKSGEEKKESRRRR